MSRYVNTKPFASFVLIDRCDNLAFRFYGDSTLWWFIAKCNDLTTNNIPAGTSLRIPIKTNEAKGF